MADVNTSFPEGAFGPSERGGRVRSGGPDWLRLGVMLLCMVLVLTLSLGATAAGVLLYGTQNIENITVDGLVSSEQDADGGAADEADDANGQDDLGVGDPQNDEDGDDGDDGDPDADEPDEEDIEEIDEVLNVLMVGNDSRDALSDEQLEELGTHREGDGVGLTDTIMLVQLDPRRDGASILSFPRDLRVERCNESTGKINAAYAIGEGMDTGGPSCLVQTVTELTDIPIHHYVEVDLAGFIDVVEALGGVSMYLDEPITDRYAGLDLPQGCVTLDGAESLGFVRARRIDNDFGRIARQQRFAREVVAQAASVETLVNIPRMYSLVEAASRAVVTDDAFGIDKMQRLAFSLRDMSPEALSTRTVPGYGENIDGVSYVVPNEDQAEELYSAFRDGGLIPEEGEIVRERVQLQPSDAGQVDIVNGGGVAWASRDSRLMLSDAGFEITDTANYPGFGVEETVIQFGDGSRAGANVLAEALGEVPIEEVDDHDGITLMIGEDYDADAAQVALEQALSGEDDPDAEDPQVADGSDEGEPDDTVTDEPTTPPLVDPTDGTNGDADDADADPDADEDADPDDDLDEGVPEGELPSEPTTSEFMGATSFDVDCG